MWLYPTLTSTSRIGYCCDSFLLISYISIYCLLESKVDWWARKWFFSAINRKKAILEFIKHMSSWKLDEIMLVEDHPSSIIMVIQSKKITRQLWDACHKQFVGFGWKHDKGVSYQHTWSKMRLSFHVKLVWFCL